MRAATPGAIPSTFAHASRAADFVQNLIGAEPQARDAAGGSTCAYRGALASVEPADATDAAGLEITRATIADSMITYPPHARFPDLEDAASITIRQAILGEIGGKPARSRVQEVADRVLG
jgi:hypothetical protein